MALLDPDIVEKDFGWPLKDIFEIFARGAGGICTNSLIQDLGEIISPIKTPDIVDLENVTRSYLYKTTEYYAGLWHIDEIYDFKIEVKLNPFMGLNGAYYVLVTVNHHQWMFIQFNNKKHVDTIGI